MAVKKNKKAVKKPTKPRPYNNSGRSEKSEQTRTKIIETLVALLVERRGQDVPMEDLAKKTGITQRTIFRFFNDKKTLHEAMDAYLLSYLQAGTEQMQNLDFIGFAKNAYALFDKHESLTMAYLFSPFGQEARTLFRKKLNQSMISRITQEKNIKLTPEKTKRLALLTSLVNAKIWFDLKNDYGFSGLDMGPTIDWALKVLLENIEKD